MLLGIALGALSLRALRQKQRDIIKDRLRVTVAERLAGTRWQQNRLAARLLDRFSQTNLYRTQNLQLQSDPHHRVVLYGDSITQFWQDRAPDTLATHPNFINRGISGQTTPALLWRLQQDVLNLHPATVILLAGTNDFFFPELHISQSETESNLRRIAALAQQHGARVILCSVLPVRYSNGRYTDRILATNASLRAYALQNHLHYVDYFAAMADAQGQLPAQLSDDGVHPNHAGYEVMAKTLLQQMDADDAGAKL